MYCQCQPCVFFCTKIPARRWSFHGPGSEEKWYSTDIDQPRREWDRVAELMMLKFGESEHPIFRSTSPLVQRDVGSRANAMENCRHTFVPIWKRQNCFFAQLLPSINSEFTELSKKCVKNVTLAMTEQDDLLRHSKIWPTVCVKCDEDTHTCDRWFCTRRRSISKI